MISTYAAARQRYKPERVRILLIAESPPASGGYFYFDDVPGQRFPLFRETMRALGWWPHDPREVDKRPLLERFQSNGFFLIDTCQLPVNQLPRKERMLAIVESAPRVASEAVKLNPDRIVIVKVPVFLPVRDALRKMGLGERVLNKEPLPFPSHGNQRIYREKLTRILARNHS